VRAFKFNVAAPTSTGDVFAYHNTGVTYEADQAAFNVTNDSEWQNLVLLNNIWVGTDEAFSYSNTPDDPFDQDFDLLHATGTGLIYFQGTHFSTVEAYNTATGLCQNCLAADPAFLDPEAGAYSLQESSPAVDQGTAIPGVNDDFVGGGPDIGAYELGGGGPDADTDADTDTDSDTDTDTNGPGPDKPIYPPDEGDSSSCLCEHAGSRSASLLGLVLDSLT
jgi:hypothetical protein